MIGLGGSVGVPYPGPPVLDYDGSSIAGLSFGGGSPFTPPSSAFWSTNGTEIEVQGPGNSLGTSYWAVLPDTDTSMISVIELDVKLATVAGSGFDRVGIVGLQTEDSSPVTAFREALLVLANGNIAANGNSVAGGIVRNTWYTLRIERLGNDCRFLVDGVVVWRNAVNMGRSLALYYFAGFGTSGGNPSFFRNITLRITDPARF